MFPLQVGVFNKRIAFWLMVAGLGLSGLISSATAIATNAPCEIQVSYSKGFKIETITNPGACDWTAPATVSQIDFQLVGGGGGGAFSAAAGGGGGGGQYVRVNSAPVVAGDVYELTVGIGGLGGVGGSQADAGASGASSQFLNYTAAGGEGGRIGTGTGAPLGNGGSSGKSASVNAGASVTAASWSGGVASDLLGTTNLSPTCPRTRLGGGGAGTTAVGGTTGIGGAGFGSTFSFSTVNYGGGGGGHRESSATYTTAADGGVGGGGAGGHAASTRPQSGVNGLGGGGGARGGQCGAASLAVAATSGGGSGGTGQVAIRYYAPEVLTAPVAVGLQSKVELQWTKSQEAYAVGYRIVWSTTQSELADAAISARTPISITSKDTTFYSHTALTNGVTYYYRLATAFTNAANQTVVSSYSSLISVSPQMTRTDKFSVTRNTQYFTVPQGVTWLEVTAVGAGANQTNGGWGTGGTVKALIP
ncbi:MAG: hypothetical protein K9G10_05240, partial [Rhodoluna sp.]|nr:hypothetical protein [Rhodoluna sp.]